MTPVHSQNDETPCQAYQESISLLDSPARGHSASPGRICAIAKWRSGEPLILLHGVPGDADTLAPAADRLADRVRAITISMRYAGSGPHGDRPFGIAQQRDDLIDIVAALGSGPVHLVAWSNSAHDALALAVQQPEIVRSLRELNPADVSS